MLKRILRSLLSLAAILVFYETYVLLAVPWLEPPPTVRKKTHVSPGDEEQAAKAVSKYQRLLAHYFPADHWSQTQPPIVLAGSSEQAMLVMDRYDRYDDGVVEIGRFALLVFPTPWRSGEEAPRDAIVLEASRKARLQFDEFLPERGRIGRITNGEFPGPIIIRSDMRQPGPDDDLRVETADLRMNSKLMYTTAPVRFRMGRNVGGGRELEVRFLSDDQAPRNQAGLTIAGVDTIEVRYDVRLRLFLPTNGLLPGGDNSAASRPGEPALPAPSPERRQPSPPGTGTPDEAPVEVTCSGPFHFDFVRYVASFDRDVEVRQLRLDGPSDQLSAQQLDIHFAPRQGVGAIQDPLAVDVVDRQQRDLGRLEPVAAVAQGHPVVVTSPQRGAEARGARVQLGLRDRRVVVSGGVETMILYGANVLRAPVIEYQHPAPESATKIGRFRAAGPGSLDYAVDSQAPEQRFRATWQKSVELGRYQGQPLLTLVGRPQLGMAHVGALAADQVQVYLRELDGSAAVEDIVPLPGELGRSRKVQVVPDRIMATGRVQIESAQLTGTTEELQVAFRREAAASTGHADGAVGAIGAGPAADGAKPKSQFERFDSADAGPQQAYHIDADRLQLQVAIRGERMAATDLTCEGNVLFREVPLAVAVADGQPLEVRGGQVAVDHLDSEVHVTIRAQAPAQPGRPPLAQVSARGVRLEAATIQLDQRENRLWVDGPGTARMTVARSVLNGPREGVGMHPQPSGPPPGRRPQPQNRPDPLGHDIANEPLEITWRGGLNFDGRFVVLDRDVLVQGADDWVRCDRLTARLNKDVKFGAQIDQSAVDLAEIECRGEVMIDHRSHDELGLASHERMRLARLAINQQTGAISGDGPGELRSTHYSSQMSMLGGPAGGGQLKEVAPPPGVRGRQLQYLRVDFQRGLVGNLYLREAKFSDRVRAVYGPIDAWEQELEASRPELLPLESMTLSCDELGLNEDPLAAQLAANSANAASRPRGPVQLRANGNVQIYGRSEAQGEFGATADSASYEQAKDVFLLKGTPRSPAQVWQRRGQGDNSKPYAAQQIRYVRSTGEASGQGIQYLEYVPNDVPRAAQRPTSPTSPR